MFRLYVAFHLFLILAQHSCKANNVFLRNCTSSCGDIVVKSPFRLDSDPENCGVKSFQLVCHNNLALLNLSSLMYYVREIDYPGLTMRVADVDVQKDNCSSIPRHSLPDLSSGSTPYDSTFAAITIVNCANPVNVSNYLDPSSCNNGTSNSTSYSNSPKGYTYAIEGAVAYVLRDSCRIELNQGTSWPTIYSENISYRDVHDGLVYGIDLSWASFCCRNFKSYNPCNIVGTVRCSGFFVGTYFTFPRYIFDPVHSAFIALFSIFGGGRSFGWQNVKPSIVNSLLGPWIPPYYYARDWRRWLFPLFRHLLGLFVLGRMALFITGGPFIVGFLIYKWKRRHLSMYSNIEEFLQTQGNFMPIRYSFSDIKKMTGNFRDKLGEGGYGSVYKGRLRSGGYAAIKVLGKSKANGQDFINEVATIGRIHHVNVVKLIGFCVQGLKRALVFEFMPNGSLDKYLFSPQVSNAISTEKMFKISLGVARGIEYLHRGCNMQILHFDIKPHNILLDENFVPKVSDFGIAKLCPIDSNIVSLTAARGTLGYMAPELLYKHIGSVSYKADVYSFGMLLMEMAGRRKNFNALANNSSQVYFPAWAYEQFRLGKHVELGNGDVTEEENKITKKIITVALWCIQLRPSERPSMHQVLEMLEKDVECLRLPPKPLLSYQDTPRQDVELNGQPLRPLSGCSEPITLIVDGR
ncbi:hypothetical protein K2173_014308 [Erythroxylum novogranatense]|uniref:Protein kinase domain-containing protein n=1 Tax=Erythroxylum novogranatense TaxID=1862640 RepID=A0AAV8SEF1_9ROSI|nr:hypothetical protein K2173_014308 [Erythroxylum novogranatense]